MTERLNEYGQPIGVEVPEWVAARRPLEAPMAGRYCRVVRTDAALHAQALWAAYAKAPDDSGWTYLPFGRPPDLPSYQRWLATAASGQDPFFLTILEEATGEPLGVAAYMRIDPDNGVIEVGHINLSPRLQRSRMATEAMFLMMRRAFDELGYRRYEWKCDSLNAPSRQAALRYGFSYEGLFRNALVYKGRNRDTAWFSVIDTEWPAVRSAFERWLDPANFDAEGRQRFGLRDFMTGEGKKAVLF